MSSSFKYLSIKPRWFIYLGFISFITVNQTYVFADNIGISFKSLQKMYASNSNHWPPPEIDEDILFQEMAPLPESNRALGADAQDSLWDDVESSRIVNLGARLFEDKRLSQKQEISCASCHQSARSFTDGEPLAIGEDGIMGPRRSMTLFGAIGADSFFWDGRAASLAIQVLEPIKNPKEMNFSLEGVLARFIESDNEEFLSAFGESPNVDLLARALSAYVASLKPSFTKFDEFLEKQDPTILSNQEILGLHLFRTKARCMNCHSGPLLTDQKFHNIGLSFAGRRNQDLGKYEITRDPLDIGAFKTPSLRGVSKAGPWMHNGMFPTLKGVVTMYSAGMPNVIKADQFPFPIYTSLHIKKLDLTQEEIEALLAFLKIL